VVPSRCRADVSAAVEPRAVHKYTALAGRAAGADRCWQVAVRLCQAKFRDFLEHQVQSSRAKEAGAIRTTSVRQMEVIDLRCKTLTPSARLSGAARDHTKLTRY
jgi:hypothetical protein